MTVIDPVLFEICSGNEVFIKTSKKVLVLNQKWVKVSIPPKAQLEPLEVLYVKFEGNRTSTFRDM